MKRLIAAVVVAGWSSSAWLGWAAAEPSPAAGVDAALFRPSIDGSGVLSLEGARLPVKHDLSWKLWFGYGKGPFDVAKSRAS